MDIGSDDEGSIGSEEIGRFMKFQRRASEIPSHEQCGVILAGEIAFRFLDMHFGDNFTDFIQGHIHPSHSDEVAFPVVNRFRDADHLNLGTPLGKIGLRDKDALFLLRSAIPRVRLVVKVILQSCRSGPALAVHPEEIRGLFPILIIKNHIDSEHRLNRAMLQQRGKPRNGNTPFLFIGYLFGGDSHGEHCHSVHEIIHGVDLIMNLLQRFVGCLLEKEIPAAEVAG